MSSNLCSYHKQFYISIFYPEKLLSHGQRRELSIYGLTLNYELFFDASHLLALSFNLVLMGIFMLDLDEVGLR